MKIDNPVLLGVSSGFGIPNAGTSGQILQKVDGVDYNTQWADNGSLATYVQAYNLSQQSISNATETTITNWTNEASFTQNAAEWNPTTGVFTATKPGWYRISAGLEFGSAAAQQIGGELVCLISINGGVRAQSANVAQAITTGIIRHTGHAHYIAKLAIGNTIQIRCYHSLGGSLSLRNSSFGTTLSIQEIPSRLIR
jgi:hypothetical protein